MSSANCSVGFFPLRNHDDEWFRKLSPGRLGRELANNPILFGLLRRLDEHWEYQVSTRVKSHVILFGKKLNNTTIGSDGKVLYEINAFVERWVFQYLEVIGKGYFKFTVFEACYAQIRDA